MSPGNLAHPPYVPLKVIKLGMDTKQVVARFEAERQALAMMDHPNIAKALDAGMIKFGQHHLHYSRLTMPDGHAPRCSRRDLRNNRTAIPDRTSSDQGGSQRLIAVESCSF